MTPFTVRLEFHADLPFFLKLKKSQVERRLAERTSVKDVIEACGVPHTEVDLILIDGATIDFAFVIGTESTVDVYPVDQRAVTCLPENSLQARNIDKFVADGHLGK